MRVAPFPASLALLVCCMSAAAGGTKDPWLGCWTRVYGADHLAKHSAQLVTAMSVSIFPRAVAGPDKYLARVQVRVRDKPEVHANFGGWPKTRAQEISG
ncbi:MAG: hypothetical protein ABSA62_00285 [Methyloceanibacter sp.]|jgi:hypothetical protein